MKDLRISYIGKDNKAYFERYSTIMEFTDYIESNPNAPITEGYHVEAEFLKTHYIQSNLIQFTNSMNSV